MRIFCLIENDLVVNRAIFDDEGIPSDWEDQDSWVESDTAQIGWGYIDGEFIPTAQEG